MFFYAMWFEYCTEFNFIVLLFFVFFWLAQKNQCDCFQKCKSLLSCSIRLKRSDFQHFSHGSDFIETCYHRASYLKTGEKHLLFLEASCASHRWGVFDSYSVPVCSHWQGIIFILHWCKTVASLVVFLYLTIVLMYCCSVSVFNYKTNKLIPLYRNWWFH